jgi:PAS domain S-box-containing protein
MTREHFPRTIGDLRPGDHLCCLYETEEEHRSVLIPFLRQGLERAEKVIYIADARSMETILGYLQSDGLDVEPYLARGQLAILTSEDTYLREGVFDPVSMIALLRSETEQALAEGYAALRVTGEMTWALRGLSGSERLIQYEALLNEFFPGSQCLAICQYDRRSFGPEVLLDVLRTHPIAAIGSQMYDNFYYLPPQHLLGADAPAAEFRSWVTQLAERKKAKEALRQSEKWYREVIGTLQQGIWVLDKDAYTTFVNPRLATMLGYTVEEMQGQHLFSFMDERGVEIATRYLARQEQGIEEQHDFEFLRKDGSRLYALIETSPFFDDDGSYAGAIAGMQDITERKQAEAALQKLSHDLGERVKELNCLYGISALVEKPGITLNEILQGTVDLMPLAWQHPEITCARVILDGQEFRTEGFCETEWRQTRDIRVHGRRAGLVQVCYLEERQGSDDGLFLKEESSLLNAIAERLGRIVERMRAEEELKHSEERYALAQRAANVGSWDRQIQTGDLHWSEQVEPMFGFGRGEFGATYEAFLQSVHPEDRRYVAESVEASVKRGADYAIEHRIVWPDGTVRWVSETGDVIRDENGKPIRMLGVVQDITERKQAEEQLRQQSQFLTSVLESLTHPFYVVQVADYTIQMANTAAYQGSLPEQTTCYALSHGRSRPCSEAGRVCPIDEIKRTRKPVTVEHVHYDADGSPRIMEVRGYPLFDEEGNVSRVIEYSLDVTERKQAEEALRESEARWRSVTEHSPDHIITLDTDLNIEFVNYASPGLTVEELIGTPLHTYVSEERQPEIKRILENVLKTAEPCSYETEYFTPDGSSIYYESRVVPRIVDDQVIGLAVSARDVTEHRRAEQALREAKEAAEQARREEKDRRLEADRRRRIAESLAGVLAALNSNQPLSQVLDYIVAQARELLDNTAVAIYRLQNGTGTLTTQATHGLPAAFAAAVDTAPGLDALRQAVASRQPVAVPDLVAAPAHLVPAAEQPVPAVPCAEAIRALLAVPIVVQDELYGGMVLYYAQPRSFSADEVELAAVLSDQVALAIGNARLREQAEQAATTAERSRLARDLHDSVTQALFSASLVAEVLPQVWQRDPEEARQGLEELRHLSRGALAEMRTLLLELRPTALVETKLDDLLMQLTEAVTSRAQLRVVLNIDPSPTLPPDVHGTFYRVAQEALNNVVKHAEASHVTVSLQASPPVIPQRAGDWQGKMVLRVKDDGPGFDQGQVGPDQLGLGIMRERAATVGGRLTIDSQPGRGTDVVLVWETPLS